jgi:hypothetical protein
MKKVIIIALAAAFFLTFGLGAQSFQGIAWNTPEAGFVARFGNPSVRSARDDNVSFLYKNVVVVGKHASLRAEFAKDAFSSCSYTFDIEGMNLAELLDSYYELAEALTRQYGPSAERREFATREKLDLDVIAYRRDAPFIAIWNFENYHVLLRLALYEYAERLTVEYYTEDAWKAALERVDAENRAYAVLKGFGL